MHTCPTAGEPTEATVEEVAVWLSASASRGASGEIRCGPVFSGKGYPEAAREAGAAPDSTVAEF
jgi:hypothetical protein